MAKNRKAVENFIITYIDKLCPGGENKNIYIEFFKNMNDKEFDEFMNDLKTKNKFLTVISPVKTKNSMTIENCIKVGKELNHNFFSKLWIGPKPNEPRYLTPVEFLILDLPVRRQSQHLTKKISVPDHNRTIDNLTFQPTNISKGAAITYPELQILASMDLDNSITELIKFRGGDKGGYNAMNAMTLRYGYSNLKTLSNYDTGVESTKTLKTYLTAMHLKNTL